MFSARGRWLRLAPGLSRAARSFDGGCPIQPGFPQLGPGFVPSPEPRPGGSVARPRLRSSAGASPRRLRGSAPPRASSEPRLTGLPIKGCSKLVPLPARRVHRSCSSLVPALVEAVSRQRFLPPRRATLPRAPNILFEPSPLGKVATGVPRKPVDGKGASGAGSKR